jgi:hypothetical protein
MILLNNFLTGPARFFLLGKRAFPPLKKHPKKGWQKAGKAAFFP